MRDSHTIQKEIKLPTTLADRLSRLAQQHQLSEDQIVEKALGILFSLSDVFDTRTEQAEWALASDESLRRIWDNDQDVIYDNWKELYGIPER